MNPDAIVPQPFQESRREFLKKGALAAAMIAGGRLSSAAPAETPASADDLPWYRRAVRWGQTNITELDPTRYDLGWWREYWKRTRVQGVVVNAGGIFAYYPSQVPFHHRAQFLGDRDLFGEVSRAAHEDGIAVFARMDSNRAYSELFAAHPDWFARRAGGEPYMAGELYVTCVNSPYYDEHIPAILREIAARYDPEGYTDNSWSGLSRNDFCYCENCRRKFRERTGEDIPPKRNWDDPVFREWIRWNYDRRIEIWELNNRVAREAGGPHCLWVGMNGGSITGQAHQFRDFRRICKRAEMLMLDDQRRSDDTGFQRNGEIGKRLHGLLGWEKNMPESMAMYQTTAPTFRVASKPEPEARMWMLEGFAGGIQPWWHFVGAYQEDRRMFRTPVPLCTWHEKHEPYLLNRRPVARVAMVWSQENTDFFGREEPGEMVDLPWNGFAQALIRARIPWLPVHADDLARDAGDFDAIILPNVGVMSDAQAAVVREFVANGGGVIASGQAGLFDGQGVARADFALTDILGVRLPAGHGDRDESTRLRRAQRTAHSYVRLLPELGAHVEGPHAEGEPTGGGERHAVLRGFDETDILPFGGMLESLEIAPDTRVLATFVPEFPIYPPETAWMREPKTEIPAIVVRESGKGARVAFLAADFDRRFARDNLPDHGDLLANVVRWAMKRPAPLSVEGRGLIDCHLYHQPGRLILHLVNLTSAGTWRAPVHELISSGPFEVAVELPADLRRPSRARSLVTEQNIPFHVSDQRARFELPAIEDHEVIVLEL